MTSPYVAPKFSTISAFVMGDRFTIPCEMVEGSITHFPEVRFTLSGKVHTCQVTREGRVCTYPALRRALGMVGRAEDKLTAS